MYEISTDERTTWIHCEGRTVGRICPVSAEVFIKESATVTFLGTPLVTFDRFKDMIMRVHGIPVPDEARPTATNKRSVMRLIAHGEEASDGKVSRSVS